MSENLNCERFAADLADYLAGSLNRAASAEMESHLAVCAACRDVAALWAKLGSIPEEMPGPRVRSRFHAMLAEQASPRRSYTAWWIGAAAAVAIIGVGAFFAGRWTTERNAEVAALRREVSGMREMVALSLLQRQSASERLRGVQYTALVTKSEPDVVDALARTLRFDSNVDVRLAAVDALRRYPQDNAARQGMVDALDAAQSPLVQIALIEALVELSDRRAVGALRGLQGNGEVNELVRQRAAWGLDQLRNKGVLKVE